jgi:hypothetical protein
VLVRAGVAAQLAVQLLGLAQGELQQRVLAAAPVEEGHGHAAGHVDALVGRELRALDDVEDDRVLLADERVADVGQRQHLARVLRGGGRGEVLHRRGARHLRQPGGERA